MAEPDGMPDRILHEDDVKVIINEEIDKRVAASGTATLVAGTVTVSDDNITANSVIRLYHRTVGGTAGALFVSAKVADTSFTIKSTSNTDTSVVKYEVVSY